MALDQSTHLRSSLKGLFPDDKLERLARDSGFVLRQRKVEPVAFFWTLVLGFGVGSKRTISSLRRVYERVTSTTLVPSAFYDRFNSRLVRFLKRALEEALSSFAFAWTDLDERLRSFLDLILVDCTIFKLHGALRSAFPGPRTNSAPAAAKLHAVVCARGAGKSTVSISSARVHEQRKFRVGPWVERRLLLFDLGYFRYQLFRRISHYRGFFVTRLKRNANPLITRIHHAVRGKSVALEGRRLQDVLGKLKREILDVEVEVAFSQRRYRGKRRTARHRIRLVAVRDQESGEYYSYLTNVPPETLFAEEIASVYRLRWEVELLFKELKSGYRLGQLGSRRREVVESLILATTLTLVASRTLLRKLTTMMSVPAWRVTAGRWWRLLESHGQELLLVLLRPPGRRGGSYGLVTMMMHELVDPHTARRPLMAKGLFR